MTSVERWTPTGITAVDRAVVTWRPASMVPAQFKDKQGNVKVEDLALAAHWLYTLDVPPLPNIPDVFVIKGRVGLMAQLQIALAARAGYDLELVESTAQRATVRIRAGHAPWKPHVTVTMAEAEKAGWTKRSPNSPEQPSNYELMPDRMLAARAITKALGLYAPGVRRGIAAAGAPVAELADDETDTGFGSAGVVGEAATKVDPEPLMVPARSLDPGGATIPEHEREPAVAAEVRADLIARLDTLDEQTKNRLRDTCLALALPNVKGPRFTRAHGALLERLITEAEDEAAARAGEPIPARIYDDSPESTAAPDVYRYEPVDDDGRPFEEEP